MMRNKKHWLLVCGFVLAMQFHTVPAHAQFVVTDPISDALTAANHIVNTILSSLKSQIDNLRERIREYAEQQMMQAELDQQERQQIAKILADLQNEYTLSDATQACAIQMAGAAGDAMNDANTSSAYAQQALSGSRGILNGADATGASAKTKRFTVCVQAGFCSDNGRYGTPGSSTIHNMPHTRTLSGDNAIYIDADMKISSVLTPLHTPAANVDPGALEYALPKTFGLDKNGYATFADSSGNISATDDQLAFIAAYQFCDSLMPALPTPAHGNHLTVDDLVNMHDDRVNTATRTAAADRCFAALRYRTACPSSSSSNFKSSDGTTCHDIQLAMCNFLKKAPKDGQGMDPSRPSLAHCDENGLSKAEYDRLMATRCHDKVWVNNLFKTLTAEKADEFMMDRCSDIETRYDLKMDQERTALEQAVNSLTAIRSLPTRSSDATSRPMGTGGSGGGSVLP